MDIQLINKDAINHESLKSGFTLAEVMITLVIVGIVAAITIPTLIINIQNAQFKVLYKRAYSVANNAVKMANSQNLMKEIQVATNDTNNYDNFNAFRDQFSVAKICYSNNNSDCWNPDGQNTWLDQPPSGQQPRYDSLAFIDSSGMSWSKGFNVNNAILVDTNSFKGPNIYGKDRWWISIGSSQNPKVLTGIQVMIVIENDIMSPNNHACPSGNCPYKSWLLN